MSYFLIDKFGDSKPHQAKRRYLLTLSLESLKKVRVCSYRKKKGVHTKTRNSNKKSLNYNIQRFSHVFLNCEHRQKSHNLVRVSLTVKLTKIIKRKSLLLLTCRSTHSETLVYIDILFNGVYFKDPVFVKRKHFDQKIRGEPLNLEKLFIPVRVNKGRVTLEGCKTVISHFRDSHRKDHPINILSDRWSVFRTKTN